MAGKIKDFKEKLERGNVDMIAGGWCLMSPSGKLVPGSFDIDQDECWSKSFSYLYSTKKWMKPFYKKWHESIAAADKRGWVVTRVTLQVDL